MTLNCPQISLVYTSISKTATCANPQKRLVLKPAPNQDKTYYGQTIIQIHQQPMCTHPCDVSIFPVTPAPWAPGSLHAWWPGTGTREIRRSPDSWLHSECNCGLFHTDLQGWCFMTGVPGKGYRGWYNHPAPTARNCWIWGLLEVWEDATQHFWQIHTNRDRVQPETKLTILPLVT